MAYFRISTELSCTTAEIRTEAPPNIHYAVYCAHFIDLLIEMNRVKEKDVSAGKETLSYYHYHKFDKLYDRLIIQAREENSVIEINEKKVTERKRGRVLLWWSALPITRYPATSGQKTEKGIT